MLYALALMTGIYYTVHSQPFSSVLLELHHNLSTLATPSLVDAAAAIIKKIEELRANQTIVDEMKQQFDITEKEIVDHCMKELQNLIADNNLTTVRIQFEKELHRLEESVGLLFGLFLRRRAITDLLQEYPSHALLQQELKNLNGEINRKKKSLILHLEEKYLKQQEKNLKERLEKSGSQEEGKALDQQLRIINDLLATIAAEHEQSSLARIPQILNQNLIGSEEKPQAKPEEQEKKQKEASFLDTGKIDLSYLAKKYTPTSKDIYPYQLYGLQKTFGISNEGVLLTAISIEATPFMSNESLDAYRSGVYLLALKGFHHRKNNYLSVGSDAEHILYQRRSITASSGSGLIMLNYHEYTLFSENQDFDTKASKSLVQMGTAMPLHSKKYPLMSYTTGPFEVSGRLEGLLAWSPDGHALIKRYLTDGAIIFSRSNAPEMIVRPFPSKEVSFYVSNQGRCFAAYYASTGNQYDIFEIYDQRGKLIATTRSGVSGVKQLHLGVGYQLAKNGDQQCCALSPDGMRAAAIVTTTTATTAHIAVWDIASGKQLSLISLPYAAQIQFDERGSLIIGLAINGVKAQVISAVITDQTLLRRKGNAFFHGEFTLPTTSKASIIASPNGTWIGAVFDEGRQGCAIFHIPGIGLLESIAELVVETQGKFAKSHLTKNQSNILDKLLKTEGFSIPESWLSILVRAS